MWDVDQTARTMSIEVDHTGVGLIERRQEKLGTPMRFKDNASRIFRSTYNFSEVRKRQSATRILYMEIPVPTYVGIMPVGARVCLNP